MLARIWKRNWVVLVTVIVHGIWGVVLIFDSAPLYTTPLGAVHRTYPFDQQWAAASLYLFASLLAGLTILYPRFDTRLSGLILTVPQQILLMISGGTAVVCVFLGHYPDGYVPNAYGNPHLFIFCDQLWPIAGVICHTLSVLDWYWWSRVTIQGVPRKIYIQAGTRRT